MWHDYVCEQYTNEWKIENQLLVNCLQKSARTHLAIEWIEIRSFYTCQVFDLQKLVSHLAISTRKFPESTDNYFERIESLLWSTKVY